ncbi:uncharacterized protein KY384_005969 [Bacidia gigantensis]|uniref:uncharacterized protein n=1 Tax=Bacidia gigantensis TaxID=2732470 RepID=UPI001D05A69C|nr:uncharacterized protein KY384_005969 [Bacidia gigantensis]KAG8529333.1 hypothetical protein KY384_005969 [Bacidia gigantensis]
MDSNTEFDINDALKYYLSDPASIATPEADGILQDCETAPESLTSATVNSVLNPIIDAIAVNPEALSRSSVFDSLQFLLKQASLLPAQTLSKLFDLLISGLSAQADIVNNDLETEDPGATRQQKHLLEMYAFLLQWSISAVEVKTAEKPSSALTKVRGKGAKSKASLKDGSWDSAAQVQSALDTMCKVLKVKLAKIFVTTSERDTFISLFTRPVYLVMESEQRVKLTALRMHAFKVLCIAIKHHGHAFGAQTAIVQNLTYYEHLAEPMAEFVHILAEQYDYPQLADEVLRDLSNKEFNNNDSRGPKSVSTFFVKLSELAPRPIMKQMTLLIKQLDSEAYALRCAIIEVCGNLVAYLSKQEERNENSKAQINAFFDILEERFLDTNPYCRCRTIQVYVKICDLDQKFPKRRQAVAELAIRSLEDKSSNVRRNAIKLVGKLVSTHPFSVMHGGQLSYSEWDERLKTVEAQLDALKPPADSPGLGKRQSQAEGAVDSALLDEASTVESPQKAPASMTEVQREEAMRKAAENAATSELLNKLQLTRKYYVEAIRFIEVLHAGTPVVCQLLSSKNKSEVIEAMDFFVILDAYKIEPARLGIRRMLRLIWTKGNSDEGKGVQTHLMDCYRGLFFTAPDTFSENDAANYVARNMISLTFGATPAELTSLEQLLNTMVKVELVSSLVVRKLWQVYGVQKQEISKTQRRGAIIVIGMLATADPEIVSREMETLLRIGLGPLGRKDLVLSKYTCLALRRMHPTKQQGKEHSAPVVRLSNEHAILSQLAAMVELVSDSKEWFGVAEQAVGAIYALSKHPDSLCSAIVRRKTQSVFRPYGQQTQEAINGRAGNESGLPSPPPEQPEQRQKGSLALSQLLFIVGHIAIKQIVHLELCELDFKRRKADKEKARGSNASPTKSANVDEQELDMIGGTTEDDFTEAMNSIRERELLYGENSLLSNFWPLVTEICANNTIYPDEDLQAAATLCMAKLMCVSSKFCETNLPLLITILERSQNPITRSNVVVALGDMAVCFNHLIDENTDFLYRRLSDSDGSVKRTCLMTLTFLILAGQVKVKGQLGEMAKCLEESDKRIADLSKMFFTELATKDNAIYNNFIDMFSLLSAEKELEEDAFKRITKFLSSFIEKDKHAKQLADKLAARLQRCETERQWNDVAYILSLLQHKNEDIQKTISNGFHLVEAAA